MWACGMCTCICVVGVCVCLCDACEWACVVVCVHLPNNYITSLYNQHIHDMTLILL